MTGELECVILTVEEAAMLRAVIERLAAENEMVRKAADADGFHRVLAARDAEIERLKAALDFMEKRAVRREHEIERLKAALRGLLDEIMCFAVDPPSAALNHAIEEASGALEPKP